MNTQDRALTGELLSALVYGSHKQIGPIYYTHFQIFIYHARLQWSDPAQLILYIYIYLALYLQHLVKTLCFSFNVDLQRVWHVCTTPQQPSPVIR